MKKIKLLKTALTTLVYLCILNLLLLIFKIETRPQTTNSPPINGGGTDGVNAVRGKTVYSSQNLNVMLVGSSSSGVSYSWTKIYDVQPVQEGYPIHTANIASPSPATTTVSGLIQGVWFYQLAVISGGTTKYDTTVVRVVYDELPAGRTYFKRLQIIWTSS